MSVEDNKNIAIKFFKTMSTTGPDDAFALLTDDATWWHNTDEPGGATFSKADMCEKIKVFGSVFEEHPVVEFGRVTAEDDRVTFEMISRGGITKGGIRYHNDYLIFIRFENGLIAEIREYMTPGNMVPVEAEMQAIA